jgi:hypothetical protein
MGGLGHADNTDWHGHIDIGGHGNSRWVDLDTWMLWIGMDGDYDGIKLQLLLGIEHT